MLGALIERHALTFDEAEEMTSVYDAFELCPESDQAKDYENLTVHDVKTRSQKISKEQRMDNSTIQTLFGGHSGLRSGCWSDTSMIQLKTLFGIMETSSW